MKWSALVIICVALLLPIIASAVLQCSLCGKAITKSYSKFNDGDIFCDDCLRTKPHCDLCGRPSLSLAFIGDSRICPKCLAHSKRCGICGQPIIGKHLSYPDLGLLVCENCAKKVPKCDLCGRPDNNLTRVGDKRLCSRCLGQAPKCYLCGQPIVGTYQFFDNNMQKKYCASCINRYPPCADCNAPVGPFGIALADGRKLCPDCYKAACFNIDQARQIKEQILGYLGSQLNMNVKHKIAYSLQGEDFLKKKSVGMAGDLSGLFWRENNQFNIYILYGLRKQELYQALAHEIAHAWMSEILNHDVNLQTNEGFAQWASYKALGYFGYDDYGQVLLKGDDVYAIGLRQILNIEKNTGKTGVFEYIRKQ